MSRCGDEWDDDFVEEDEERDLDLRELEDEDERNLFVEIDEDDYFWGV